MLKISSTLEIPQEELEYRFTHASGPGGQNANKVASVVQLRFDIRNSPSLPDEIRDHLILLAGSKVNSQGILIIEAKRFRTQDQNRTDAESRLIALVQKAMVKTSPRRPTKPSTSSQIKRLASKKHRGLIKRRRGIVKGEEE